MSALYEDAGLSLDEGGMTIKRYYFPFANAKRIAYSDVQGIKSQKMGWASGKGRIWGAGDPRYWFPLDARRGRKSTLLVIDVGRRVRACITPEDPDKVVEILRAKVKV
ncbi:PH domain-containing protein [Mycobacterium sp. ML4]